MKNNIIVLLITLFCLLSCKKNDTESNNSVSSAKYRVKEIKGKNSSWGEYRFEFFYNPTTNAIDSAFRYDSDGRIQGNISKSTGENDRITYNINDLVNNIDADSIKRLDAVLKGKYGVGNYSLFDSIPKITRALYSASTAIVDGDMQGVYTYYKQRKEFGTGVKFDNTYIILKKETIIYEYGENGVILNCRAFEDTYEDSNTEKFKRRVYKSEFLFNNEKVSYNNIYMVDNSTSNTWDLLSGRKFTYDGEKLLSIKGDKYEVNYTYAGNKLTNVTDGSTQYSIDENGCVTHILYKNGDYMDIQYESGAGTFDVFSKLEYKQTGIPTIR